MIVVLAVDALEIDKVEEFDCDHLMQRHHGTTDISEFSEPRTMVLWSSFMTGENMEEDILAMGDKEMWNTRIPLEDTFFSEFDRPKIIDLPGFNYDLEVHQRSRELLKEYFEEEDKEKKEAIRKEYNSDAFDHHRKVKLEFKKALNGDHDLVLGYFSAIDVIGHLNFGNRTLLKMLYRDMDELAEEVNSPLVVLSDHGMEAVGMFGDHSDHGFWSAHRDLGTPSIRDFPQIIKKMKEESE